MYLSANFAALGSCLDKPSVSSLFFMPVFVHAYVCGFPIFIPNLPLSVPFHHFSVPLLSSKGAS